MSNKNNKLYETYAIRFSLNSFVCREGRTEISWHTTAEVSAYDRLEYYINYKNWSIIEYLKR